MLASALAYYGASQFVLHAQFGKTNLRFFRVWSNGYLIFIISICFLLSRLLTNRGWAYWNFFIGSIQIAGYEFVKSALFAID